MSTQSSGNFDGRVAKVETEVRGLKDQVNGLEQTMSTGFRDMSETLSRMNRTDWSTIWVGLGVAITIFLAIWAALIRPLEDAHITDSKEIARHTEIISQNAGYVSRQNEDIIRLQEQVKAQQEIFELKLKLKG